MRLYTLLLVICVLGFLVTSVNGQEAVCYKSLECFPTGEPWSSFFRQIPPPQGPDYVKVFFALYTRANPTEPFYISEDNDWSVEGTYYDSSKPTAVYIHGYKNAANTTWSLTVKDALIRSMDANVILVDYSSITAEEYQQAVSNARVIGAFVAKFLQRLIQEKGASPSQFHLIGFSLGAHITGYVGKRIPGIARITGLDPAQPLFEGHNEAVRLNKGDATYVDIGHTNGSPTIPLVGLGFSSSIGDVDFYFNGGWDQPGCTGNTVGEVLNGNVNIFNALGARFGCPHERALGYFVEALTNPNCTFWGIKREVFNAILRIATGGWLSRVVTSLSKCTIDTCIPFGLRTFEFPGRGSFDIATDAVPPYCVYNKDADDLMERLLNKYKSS